MRLACVGTAAALAAVGTAGVAAAADEKPSVNEQILEILRRDGRVSEEEYDALRRQAAEEEAAAEAPAAEPAPPVAGAAPAGWDVGWKNGFYVNSADGAFKLGFGGRTQLDGAVINFSDNLSDFLGSNGDGSGVEFRRARIFLRGTVYEHGIFMAEYDFADEEPQFKDVWIGLTKIPGVDQVRFGHMKEPFSLDQMTSDSFTSLMERSLPDVFSPARNTGVLVERTFLDQRFYAGLGGFAQADDFGEGFDNSSHYNLTARMTGLPIYLEDGRWLLHLGVQYSHQFRNDDTVQYRQRPESHLAEFVADTGVVGDVDGIDLFGAEIAGVCGPLHAQAEVMVSYVQRGMGMSDPRFWGTYAEVGYYLTGEHRAYKPASGVFDRTSPRQNFSIAKGTWGAWEVIGRYSYLDLDDRDIRGGVVEDMTAGLSWYLFPNLRLMTNYVYSWRHAHGNASIVEGRVNFDF
jgi:phosphate-selective porin OprO/OprP